MNCNLFRYSQITNGKNENKNKANKKSKVRLFRLFVEVEMLSISIKYKSPAVSIELLPIKYILLGWAILNSTLFDAVLDIQVMIDSAVVFFAQKITSSISCISIIWSNWLSTPLTLSDLSSVGETR